LFIHKGRWESGDDPNKSQYRDCAIRSQRWRLVNNRELFDIQNDPFESSDVAGEHPEVVAELRTAYDDWWEKTVPLMVNENAIPTTMQPQAVRYERQKSLRGIPKWTPPTL
jgi:arylsulfatase